MNENNGCKSEKKVLFVKRRFFFGLESTIDIRFQYMYIFSRCVLERARENLVN